MSRNLYVTINEAKSGKSAVSLGLMELLEGTIQRVGFFRPIARMRDAGFTIDPNIDLVGHVGYDRPIVTPRAKGAKPYGNASFSQGHTAAVCNGRISLPPR